MPPFPRLAPAALLAAVALCACARAAPHPHLVFILSDDLGSFAPGYVNPAIISPALDALAADGVVLSSFYSYKFCSPSRTSFLTGRMPYKLEGTRDNLIPFSQLDGLNLNFTLLPAKLKQAGYTSIAVGKWHAGLYSPAYLPLARGFDAFNGFLAGGQDHFSQQSFGECGCAQKDITVNSSVAPALQGEYNAVRFASAAVAAIEANDAATTPLFLFVALQNTHAPLQAAAQWEALYPGIAYAKRRAYMAMVSTIDSAVANVTAALKRTGHWGDTLFVWASDNGAPVEAGGSNWPLRGGKGTNFEGGVRLPALVNGGRLAAALRGKNETGLVHMCDLYATFAAQAGVDPSDGAWAPVDGLDLSALLVSGANATSPRTRIVHQHDMYNKSAGAVGALRDGDWKLIVGTEKTYAGWYGVDSADHFSPPESGALNTSDACSAERPCLFNVAEDAQERHDLAASRPDKVAELLAIFHSYDSEHHPSPVTPATDAAGCCAASKANGGYLAPWRADP